MSRCVLFGGEGLLGQFRAEFLLFFGHEFLVAIRIGRIHSPGPRLWNSAASRNVVRRMAPAVQPLAIGDRRFFNRQKHVSSLGTFTLVGHTFQLALMLIELCCAKTRVLKSSAAHQAAWKKTILLFPYLAALIAIPQHLHEHRTRQNAGNIPSKTGVHLRHDKEVALSFREQAEQKRIYV